MKKLLLLALTVGASYVSFSQCEITAATEANVNSVIGNGACVTVTVQPGLTGTVVTTNEITINGVGRTIDLSGGDLTFTSTNGGVSAIFQMNGSNNTLNGANIFGAPENGVLINGSGHTVSNSEIYEVGQETDTLGSWTGIVTYGFAPRQGNINFAGIEVSGSGGNFAIENNTLSGNNGHGVWVNGNNTGGTITGNQIGLTANGLEPYGNFGEGILIQNSQNVQVIGNFITANGNRQAWEDDPAIAALDPGSDQAAGLQASNHLGSGVEVWNSDNNTIQGNFIGTNKTGSSITSPGGESYGNQKHGIYVRGNSEDNLVGGTGAGEGNIIGGNGYAFEDVHTNDSPNPGGGEFFFGVGHGIQIHGSGGNVRDNEIYGNFVGWYDGNCLPNRQDAMSVLGFSGSVTGNQIGGDQLGIPGESNIFTGGQFGVFIQGSTVSGNDVLGNYIGTNTDANCPDISCAPADGGIFIQSGSANNNIGSETAPNFIANLNGTPVEVSGNTSIDNTIQGNVMKCNGGGIVLGNSGNENYASGGVTINSPTSTEFFIDGLTVATTDRIDVYVADTICGSADALCQNGGSGIGAAGMKWVTSISPVANTIFTDATQPAYWSLNITPAMQAMGLSLRTAIITATENNGLGSTSEFSTCSNFTVCEEPNNVTITPSATTYCEGGSVTLSVPLQSTYVYRWLRSTSSAGVFSVYSGNTGTNLNSITVSDPGFYKVEISHPDAGGDASCMYETATVEILEDAEQSGANAGSPVSVCETSSPIAAVAPTIGSGTWSGTGVTFTNASNASTTVNGLAIGANTLTWTVRSLLDVCPPKQNTVVITRTDFLTVADAGTPQVLCDNETVTLTGSTLKTGETAVWTGPGTITSPTNPTTTVTGLASEQTHTFTYTISNGVCADVDDQTTVQIDETPTAAAAGSDADICADSYQLQGSDPSPGTGLWTSVPAVTILNPTSNNATVSGIADGQSVTLTWTVSNGACSSSDDEVVVARAGNLTSPGASAAVDTVCEGSTVQLTGNAAGAGETGTWTGPGTINQTGGNATVTGLVASATRYDFTYTMSNGICPDAVETVSIRIDADPTTSNAGSDDSICEDTYTLSANAITIGTGVWTSNNGVVAIDDVTDPTTSVSGIPEGATVEFTWTATNGACASSVSTVDITRTNNLAIPQAGGDDTFCDSEDISLTGNAAGAGETVTWTGPGIINTPNSPSTTVSGLGNGNYEFVYTISNGVCADLSDTVAIQVDELPGSFSAGANDTICSTTDTLNATPVPTGGTFVGTWISDPLDNLNFDNVNDPNTLVSGIDAGETVQIIWSVTNGVCPASNDTILITRVEELTTADAGLDGLICAGNDIVLTGNVPKAGETVTWTAVDGLGNLSATDIPSVTVSGLNTTSTFSYTIENRFCSAPSTDIVEVVVQTPATANITDPSGFVKPTDVSTTNVTANASPTGYTATWAKIRGVGNFSGSLTSTTTTVDGLLNDNDSLFISWTFVDNLGICPTTVDSAVVVKLDITGLENLDETICESDLPFGQLVQSPPDVSKGEVAEWVVAESDPFTPGAQSHIMTPTITGPGTYTYTYRITNTGTNAEIEGVTTIVVDAVPSVANIITPDDTICIDNHPLEAEQPTTFTSIEWTSPSNNLPLLTNTSALTPNILGIPVGTSVTYAFNVTNGVCPASSDTVVITRTRELTPPNPNPATSEICENASINLFGAAPNTTIAPPETSLWAFVQGAGTIDNPTASSTSVSNLDPGINIISYTMSNGICPDEVAEVTITVDALPDTARLIGEDSLLICDASSEIRAETPTSGNGIWTTTSNNSIASATDPITSVDGFDEGESAEFTWTISSELGICTETSEVTVFVERIDIPDADIDDGTASCPGIENILTINNPTPDFRYEWTMSPSGFIRGGNTGTTVVVETPDGDYTVTVTTSSTEITCSEDVTEPITVNDLIESADITGLTSDFSERDVKCVITDERFSAIRVLNANVSAGTAPNLTYNWSYTNGRDTIEVSGNDQAEYVHTFTDESGDYIFFVEVINEKCDGDTLRANTSIEVEQSVPVNYELEIIQAACEDEVAEIRVLNNGVPDPNAKYVWYHNTDSIHTNIVNYTNGDSLELTQTDLSTDPITELTSVNTGSDQIIDLEGGNKAGYDTYSLTGVRGETVIINADPEYCIEYLAFDSTRGKDFLRDTISTNDFVLIRPGAVATAIDLGTQEITTISETLIQAGAFEPVEGELNMERIELRFALYDMTGSTDGVNINWYEVISEDPFDTSNVNIISNQEPIAYPTPTSRPETVRYMLLRDNGECKDSSYVTINIDFMPWPPNAFSPNGDGNFDTFEIYNVDKYEGTSVTIYNRWGTELIKIDNYHLEENWWDGTVGGTELPAGAYYYLVDLNNGIDPFTGTISLIK